MLKLRNQIVESDHPLNEEAKKGLFERLGGQTAIDELVERMYGKIFVDHELEGYFKETNHERWKEMQKKYLATAFGKEETWQGKNMIEAHVGYNI